MASGIRTSDAVLAKVLAGASTTASDGAALAQRQVPARRVARGKDIIVQGRRYDGVFALIDGFALRYKIMADGRRQILNVALPGDMIGFPACFFDRALYSVTALTRVTVSAMSFDDIAGMIRDHPRFASALLRSSARETAMLGEHLAGVGRRNADERVAHFILEMATRLRAVGLGDDATFVMPLTQALIADLLGLSVPHVNRTLRRLREQGFIETVGAQMHITDREALAALADFDGSYLAAPPAPDIRCPPRPLGRAKAVALSA